MSKIAPPSHESSDRTVRSDSFGLLPSPAGRIFGSFVSMNLQAALDRFDAAGDSFGVLSDEGVTL